MSTVTPPRRTNACDLCSIARVIPPKSSGMDQVTAKWRPGGRALTSARYVSLAGSGESLDKGFPDNPPAPHRLAALLDLALVGEAEALEHPRRRVVDRKGVGDHGAHLRRRER